MANKIKCLPRAAMLVATLLWILGCAGPKVAALSDVRTGDEVSAFVVGATTREEVIDALGPPLWELQSDGIVAYRSRVNEPPGNSAYNGDSRVTFDHIFVFDSDSVLRASSVVRWGK